MARNWRAAAGGNASFALLVTSLVTGLFTHAYHVTRYPLILTDEGIYVQQAWSLVNEGRLSPYTYFYDHAPFGWMVMAAWSVVLPSGFHTFGNEVNTVRVLMVLVHVVSVGLLFGIVRRFSGSAVGAFVAAFVFNFSPLAIYYQRQVLLDNVMVMWLLLSVYLLARKDGRVVVVMAAGLSFGLALVTKENAVFCAPAVAYLLYQTARGRQNHRFVTRFWWTTLAVPVGAYFLFALLKNELIPTGLNFDKNNPPADHVSLLYSIWWQLNRTGPPGENLFLHLLRTSWLPKDRLLLTAGSVAVLAVLWLWGRDRQGRPGYLVAALLALGYAVYLARGSQLLDFYVAPLVPLLAMNLGILCGHVAQRLTVPVRSTATAGLVAVVLILPGAYLFHHDTQGRLQFQDLYHLDLTSIQEQQINFVLENVPPDSRIITDDDIWTALHSRQPVFPRAHSHFKASSDPDVRDKLFQSDWRNIDYVVMSNKMHEAMVGNNAGGREAWILEAVDQHSQQIAHWEQGDIQLAVYKITS
jgi:4-amino-4-deoxy-L-arabinose transferase-like glycosyltransferase